MDRSGELWADVSPLSEKSKRELRVKLLYRSILRVMGAFMPRAWEGTTWDWYGTPYE